MDFEHTVKRNGNDLFSQFLCLRKLRNCNRFSGFELIKPRSVAEHCYYTAMIFEYIVCIENKEITIGDLLLVLKHDVLEAVTGDVLRPAKTLTETIKDKWDSIENEIRGLDQLNFLEPLKDEVSSFSSIEAYNIFKIADVLECYIYICEEITLGNNSKDIKTTFDNLLSCLNKYIEKYPCITNFINFFI